MFVVWHHMPVTHQVAPQHELITVNVGTVGSTQLFPVNYEATKVK